MPFIRLSIVFILWILPAVGLCSGYKTEKNIPYQNGKGAYADKMCMLDIHYPVDTTGCPVVVWFHGGGLTGGSREIPRELKNQGLTVIGVEYRLLPQASLDECIDDAAAAVAWAFHNAEQYGGDPTKIFVAGHSAGGYLTNMVGLDKKWLAAYGIDADSIAALVPYSGHAISHFAYRKAKGMKDTQPSIDEYAPLYYVRSDAPPMIIISGDREMEMLGRYEETAYLWRMMKVNGHKETYLYELDGYNHGDMAIPGHHILKDHIKRLTK